MNLSSKDRKAIKFIAEFLGTVIHEPITPAIMVAAAENKTDQSAMWGTLVDLSLIYTTQFPDEPKAKLYQFWRVLSEEGHEHVPVEGEHGGPDNSGHRKIAQPI